jgi:hypothetical protein
MAATQRLFFLGMACGDGTQGQRCATRLPKDPQLTIKTKYPFSYHTAGAVFGPDILPHIVVAIRAFVPPFPTPLPPAFEEATALRRTLVSADFEAFLDSCSLLETLALDDEDVRLSLARGMTFPDEHGGVRCLAEILEFIDRGDYHPLWKDQPNDTAQRERSFDFCKAALIKAVVEIAGEEKSVDVLWDESDQAQPGGALVAQMVQWIKAHKNLKEKNRDDLLVCATLTLGNLLRHGASYALVILERISSCVL